MKNLKKKIAACLTVALVLGVTAVPAFASTEMQEVQPRYDICSCGGRILSSHTSENVSLGEGINVRPCTHGHSAMDNYERFKYTDKKWCTSCSFEVENVTYGYEWVCYGR